MFYLYGVGIIPKNVPIAIDTLSMPAIVAATLPQFYFLLAIGISSGM